MGATRMSNRIMATADDRGQSRLVKNSSYRVRPIMSESSPPSNAGMTNSPSAGMNTSRLPAMMPGRERGRVISRKTVQGPGAQVGSRFVQAVIQSLQVGVERQDHERQVGIDNPQVHGKIRIQQLQRLVDEADGEQQVVDQRRSCSACPSRRTRATGTKSRTAG